MREALEHFYEDADSLVIKPTVGAEAGRVGNNATKLQVMQGTG
jgi:hypothetical protein